MKEKKSLGIIALLCLTIFIFLGTPSLAGEKLVVAVNANWPPMQMKDDAGNITGYEIDMIHAVATEAGFQVQLVVVPWNSLFKELKAGTFDAVMASVSITKGRTARYDFSDPYFSTEQLIVVRKDQAEASLTGKAI
ncbi:MAG: transporter substrate-binding domain-containing protein, partial [Desulfomonilia bacterium]|nr:transporter substrate-binding domain-containing protein [Desulfomonilia bacterium]